MIYFNGNKKETYIISHYKKIFSNIQSHIHMNKGHCQATYYNNPKPEFFFRVKYHHT